MLLDDLKNRINPPKWLASNTHLLVVMGSTAYGANDSDSDWDCYGFAIPPKETVFPHLRGEIPGFSTPGPQFAQWHETAVHDEKREYDFTVYSIVKYFRLCMDNNPNMVDSLFVPRRCVLHATSVGERVREQRHLFLHQGSYKKFKGYAYAQMQKVLNKKSANNEKRNASIEEHGYDVKAGYHIVRLALECEQLLREGTLDLEANSQQLRAIRRGEWSKQQLTDWFAQKELQLESYLDKSPLPILPDEAAIRDLLLECLEMHYGSLDAAISVPVDEAALLSELRALVDRYQ